MPQLQKCIHLTLQTTAWRALGFSQAVHASLASQQQLAKDEINEVEECLGLLRVKKAMIKLHVGVGIVASTTAHGNSDFRFK